jgi:hypothetical protein
MRPSAPSCSPLAADLVAIDAGGWRSGGRGKSEYPKTCLKTIKLQPFFFIEETESTKFYIEVLYHHVESFVFY